VCSLFPDFKGPLDPLLINIFMAIAKNYQQVMPGLIVKNADQFIQFARKVLDAKENYSPMRDENQPCPAGMFL
jgi:hypothetical protein